MRLRASSCAALLAALSLGAGPAYADNYVVRDGLGALQTFASKLISGVHYPIHLLGGMFGSTPVPIAVDGSGNVGTNVQSSALPSGAATAAIQSETHAAAGSDAAKAVAVQFITGGKAVSVACTSGCASGVAFTPTGNATLAITTSSARVALPSADVTALIRNTGAADVYLALGNSTVTATTGGMLLPAGQAVALNIGANSYVAGITSAGSSSIAVSTGTGVPALTGGGGSGGGGGVVSFANTTPSSINITAADAATTTIAGQNSVTLRTGAATANSTADFAAVGQSTATITVSGTFVGTLSIEGSGNGGGSSGIYAPVSGLIRGANVTTSSVTAPTVISLPVGSITNLRLRASAWTSGTAVVAVTYSPASGETKIANPLIVSGQDAAGAALTKNPVVWAGTDTGDDTGAVSIPKVVLGQLFTTEVNSSAVLAAIGVSNGHLGTLAAAVGDITPTTIDVKLINGVTVPTGNGAGTTAMRVALSNDWGPMSVYGTTHSTVGLAIQGRVATTVPTARTDGQAVEPMFSPYGKFITDPYAAESLRSRGTGSTTGTSATAFTGWTAPGTGLYAFITGLQCWREDAGTTAIHVTLNDTAGTVEGLAGNQGGTNLTFSPPLRVNTSATAPTFTINSAVTTAYCSAQGFVGGL